MNTPLVSVVTPTWNRRGLLLSRCVPSVADQTYPQVEHVVVSDGPDAGLAETLRHLPVVYGELPVHDPDPNQFGVHARNRGAELAGGELLAYLDDDNAYRPQHLQLLVDALLDSGADFAYSRMAVHDGTDPPREVGAQPPVCGQIDSSLLVCRRELLQRAAWRSTGGYAVDWDLVERWLAARATWTFIDHLTLDYWKQGAT